MTVCLNMIVKDEAAIIGRCLDAAAPWVDCYAIHDTGSTDGTPEVIETHMAALGVPGVVTHGEFRNFAQARNDALAHGRASGADWLLLVDADMELVVDDPAWRDGLTGDAHTVVQAAGDFTYSNVRLVCTGAVAEYVGVTHEVLTVDATPLEGLRLLDHVDGSSRPDKYERDLRLLTDAHQADPGDTRTVFYLAQTHRDAGNLVDALGTYAHRAAMGGWPEEVWYSLFQIAVLVERLGGDPVAAYLAAFDYRPSRAEPLVELARYHREHDQVCAAWLFAEKAAALPLPDDVLFIDTSAYGWRLHDEAAIAAYWAGHRDASAAHARAALEDCPAEHRPRIEQNLTYTV